MTILDVWQSVNYWGSLLAACFGVILGLYMVLAGQEPKVRNPTEVSCIEDWREIQLAFKFFVDCSSVFKVPLDGERGDVFTAAFFRV